MEVNLVAEAVKFMVLGMGIVFLFLILMILILKLQASILTKFFPEKEEVKANTWQPTAAKQDDKAKIAALRPYNIT